MISIANSRNPKQRIIQDGISIESSNKLIFVTNAWFLVHVALNIASTQWLHYFNVTCWCLLRIKWQRRLKEERERGRDREQAESVHEHQSLFKAYWFAHSDFTLIFLPFRFNFNFNYNDFCYHPNGKFDWFARYRCIFRLIFLICILKLRFNTQITRIISHLIRKANWYECFGAGNQL